MTAAMQQALLRRGCARLTEALGECVDLPAGELLMARLSILEVLGIASRGPVLALPWTDDEPRADRKMKAGADDTFTS